MSKPLCNGCKNGTISPDTGIGSHDRVEHFRNLVYLLKEQSQCETKVCTKAFAHSLSLVSGNDFSSILEAAC